MQQIYRHSNEHIEVYTTVFSPQGECSTPSPLSRHTLTPRVALCVNAEFRCWWAVPFSWIWPKPSESFSNCSDAWRRQRLVCLLLKPAVLRGGAAFMELQMLQWVVVFSSWSVMITLSLLNPQTRISIDAALSRVLSGGRHDLQTDSSVWTLRCLHQSVTMMRSRALHRCFTPTVSHSQLCPLHRLAGRQMVNSFITVFEGFLLIHWNTPLTSSFLVPTLKLFCQVQAINDLFVGKDLRIWRCSYEEKRRNSQQRATRQLSDRRRPLASMIRYQTTVVCFRKPKLHHHSVWSELTRAGFTEWSVFGFKYTRSREPCVIKFTLLWSPARYQPIRRSEDSCEWINRKLIFAVRKS